MTLCLIAAFCAGLAGSASGKTVNKAAAREAYQRGIEHYNLNEFAAALDAFREAYRNYSDASFLFNIGQCQRQLGDKANAILSYRAYLRESPNAPNRIEVQQMIVTLESAVRDEQRAQERPAPAPAKVEPTPEAKPAPAAGAPALTATAPAPEPEHKPLYKRWWLWTAVGVVAVAGVAVGLGVGLTRGTSYPSASTSNGTFAF